MLRKGAPTLFSSIEGKLLNFNLVLWLASSRLWNYRNPQLNCSLVLLSAISCLYFTWQVIIKAVNYLKIVGIKQQWPVSTDNSCQWFRTTTHRCDWIGQLRSGDLISGIVQYMLIGVRFYVNWWARGREWPNKIRRAIVDCLAFLYLQGLKVIEWISRAHSVYKDGHRFWFVAYPSY